MAQLHAGQTMPDFTYDTPFAQGCQLSETVRKVPGKTALVFLRYYGCTLCQYDIHRYAQAYAQITAEGGQMLVVLQSDPAKLAAQLTETDLPFAIVCDPAQKLYQMLEIHPAANKLGLLNLHTMAKIAKAQKQFTHGDYEGDELQLPAVFVLDGDLHLTWVHYGTAVNDVPEPEELAELLR